MIVEVGEIFLWIKFLRRYRVTTGAEGMIGERAEVISRCDPRGSVRVHGEIWNARCEPGAEPARRCGSPASTASRSSSSGATPPRVTEAQHRGRRRA